MNEPELEYIEEEVRRVRKWGEEIEKRLKTISSETLTKIEEAENKDIIIHIDPRELRLSPLNPRQQVYPSGELERMRQNISLTRKINDPLLVRLKHSVPEVITGSLRWRFSILYDLGSVPIIVKSLTDEEALREIESSDINVKIDPISRGEWYLEHSRKYGSYRELARIIGVDEHTVRNYSALCTFPDIVKEAIRREKMNWKIAYDIREEVEECGLPERMKEARIIYYTREYLRLRKDKTQRLTRDKFKEWMRAKRQYEATKDLAKYGKPYQRPKSKVEREIERMDREREELYTTMPPHIAENKAKILLESAPEEVQKEYEGKVFGKDYSLPKLEHDITVAEGNLPKLKIIELAGELFKTEKEADEYFKKFRGRLLQRTDLWIGEVDPFLYAESKKEKKQ